MSNVDIESAPEALRELAAWVVRDGVDSDHLADYMRRLLNQQFIELHASCRREAVIVARCFPGLNSWELARLLFKCANETERASSPIVPSSPPNTPERSVNFVAPRTALDRIPCQLNEAPDHLHQFLWVPELIAAIVFMAVSAALLIAQSGDSTLRMIAASGYGLLGLTYALAATCSARACAPRLEDRLAFLRPLTDQEP